MIKVRVHKDEWYPVYELLIGWNDPVQNEDDEMLQRIQKNVEVSKEFLQRCRKAFTEFDLVQEELRVLAGFTTRGMGADKADSC